MTIRRLQKQLSEQNARLQQEICLSEASRRDRQKVEEKLVQSEAKFRNLFENSPVGIFRAHIVDGLIVEANQRLIQMLGYSHTADVINQAIADLYIALDAPHLMLKELQTKGEVNLETQLRKQDGTPISVIISARMNAEEDCLQAVVIEIGRSL